MTLTEQMIPKVLPIGHDMDTIKVLYKTYFDYNNSLLVVKDNTTLYYDVMERIIFNMLKTDDSFRRVTITMIVIDVNNDYIVDYILGEVRHIV